VRGYSTLLLAVIRVHRMIVVDMPLCSSQCILVQFMLQFCLCSPKIPNNHLWRGCLPTAAKDFPAVRAEVKGFMKHFAIYGYMGQT